VYEIRVEEFLDFGAQSEESSDDGNIFERRERERERERENVSDKRRRVKSLQTANSEYLTPYRVKYRRIDRDLLSTYRSFGRWRKQRRNEGGARRRQQLSRVSR
jgi:hypothetical protein